MPQRLVKSMFELAAAVCRDERGQGFVEYAFALVLVVTMATAVFATVGLQDGIAGRLTAVGNAILAAV
jgi:Flp pilus assembly pilin Flp